MVCSRFMQVVLRSTQAAIRKAHALEVEIGYQEQAEVLEKFIDVPQLADLIQISEKTLRSTWLIESSEAGRFHGAAGWSRTRRSRCS